MGCTCSSGNHNFKETTDLKTLLVYMDEENKFLSDEMDAMATDFSKISQINFTRQCMNNATENYNFLKLKTIDVKSDKFIKLKELVQKFYDCTNLTKGSPMELNNSQKELSEFIETLHNK